MVLLLISCRDRDAEAAETIRKLDLAICLGDAERAYDAYVKLNGTETKDKPGTWRAPTRVWETAAANKRNDIAECGLRHGR